jgi:hypothetical protein
LVSTPAAGRRSGAAFSGSSSRASGDIRGSGWGIERLALDLGLVECSASKLNDTSVTATRPASTSQVGFVAFSRLLVL